MTRITATHTAGFDIRVSFISNMSSAKPLSYSFPPVVGSKPKVLILGSMPGVASLEAQQYYAHPRNAFWPIMAALFDINLDWSYQTRCQYLADKGVAVWDVLKACHRPGSLDQHIDPASIEANDFEQFFSVYPTIEAIFFNGGKSQQVFQRHVLPNLPQSPSLTRLPSTSPAHASLNFNQKLDAWKVVKLYC